MLIQAHSSSFLASAALVSLHSEYIVPNLRKPNPVFLSLLFLHVLQSTPRKLAEPSCSISSRGGDEEGRAVNSETLAAGCWPYLDLVSQICLEPVKMDPSLHFA